MTKSFNQLTDLQRNYAVKYAFDRFDDLLKEGTVVKINKDLVNLEDLALVAAEHSLYKVSDQGLISEVLL